MLSILRVAVLLTGLTFLAGLGGVGAVQAAPADTAAFAQMGDWDDWSWGWIVMMPMMVVFWGGVIWLIVWLVRRTGGEPSTRYDDDPMDIARRRYARGEISSEELDQIRHTLRG
jgi:putative membrane protein